MSSHFWELFSFRILNEKSNIKRKNCQLAVFLWEIFKRKLFKNLKIREWKINSILYYFIFDN